MAKSLESRSTEEVQKDHLELAANHDWETDVERNFAEDCVLLTNYGVFRGREGLWEEIRHLERVLPNGRYEYCSILCEGEIGFLVWKGESEHFYVDDGADSYLIRDGCIQIMTIHYTVKPKRKNKGVEI